MSPDQKTPEGRSAPRRFLRPREAALGAAVAVICLLVIPRLLPSKEPGRTAVVFLDSDEILSIPLRAEDEYRVDLTPEYAVPVSFEVRGGGIRYVDVDCPDHICEKTGVISSEGQTAVCMPNEVAVLIR